MKNKIFIIGLCVILLISPSLLAFPTPDEPSLIFSSLEMSDGTFIGTSPFMQY